MAGVIDVFPRRPLALRTDPRRRRNRILLLVAAFALALPSLYWGYQTVHSAMLRADLKARGVPAAETLGAEGDCTSRRSRLSGDQTPIDCWLNATYRLRPEEGGGTRTAPVHLEGAAPIFTPTVIYDPQDPDRVMLEPEMERSLTWSELLGPVFLLLFPAIVLLIFFLGSRRGLAKAARNPDPAVACVERVNRQPRKLYLHSRLPGAARPHVDVFTPPEGPLLVPPPPGAPADSQWVLALKSGGGHYVLDEQLAWLDLADDERNRVLSAARGY
ncbi:MAG: hypothetical protein JO276_02160 [Sphingomonadaceae bacterium]|nr:hypothetical protein [Sphingomonadaceae bacterium]